MTSHRIDSLVGAVGSVVERLEQRTMLCAPHMLANLPEPPKWSEALEADAKAQERGGTVIVWANRNQPGDNFNTTFGTKAEDMRGIVDAALQAWQQVITDWNRSDSTVGLQVNIRIAGGGFGGAAAPERDPPSDGKPRTGSVDLGGGNGSADPNDTNGWYLDPNPFDNSEFIGDDIKSAYVAENSADSGADFFSLVTIEMAHVLGLISDRNNDGGDWNPYRLENFVTNTGLTDTVHNNGKFFVFDGPTIDHLMTGFNGGDGPPNSWGNVVHSANAPADIDFNGQNWRGTDDIGNGAADFGRASLFDGDFGYRYLPSFTMAHMFKDAYQYTIAEPQTFGTMYALINETTGRLNIRGATGSTNSADVITVSFINGDTIRVRVDIGNDTPGTGAFSGAANLPPFVTDFLAIGVTEILITAGDGNDTINIESLPSFADATVNGGLGDDSIAIGGISRTLSDVDAPVLVDGDSGADIVNFNDQSAGGPGTFSLSANQLTSPAVVNFTRVEDVNINAGPFGDNISITGSAAGTAFLANGNGGNDTVRLGSGNVDANLNSSVPVNGGAGTDNVIIDNTQDATVETLTLQGLSFTDGLTHTFASIESIDIRTGIGGGTANVNSNTVTTTVTGSTGDDLVNIGDGSLANNLGANVVVNGGAGTDRLSLLGQNDGSSNTYTFSSVTQFRLGDLSTGKTVTFSQIEQATLRCGIRGDTIDINAASIPLSIFAGEGNDAVTVSASAAAVTVDTGPEQSAPFGFRQGDSLIVGGILGNASVVVEQNDTVINIGVNTGSTLRLAAGAVLTKAWPTVFFIDLGTNLSGTLDVGSGAFLWRSGGSIIPDFRALVSRGYNGGAWNGTHASGSINSSLAAGGLPNDALGYGLGSEIAVTSIGGFNIAPGDTLIRYTLYGDADLNGAVNFDDYARTDNGFLNNRSGWVNGDFDYNNVVNFDDYSLIDNAFLSQVSGQSAPAL